MKPRPSRPVPDGRVRVIPSLLAADFAALRDDARRLAAAGADWFSVDVMDGHFVPNLSFGPDVLRSLRKPGLGLDGVRLDAHLMVEDPAFFGPIFAAAGADWVIFHLEPCRDPRRVLRRLRQEGVGVGLAIKPKTPARALVPYLAEIDLALVMTVEPGFGGQAFLSGMLPKIKTLRRAIEAGRHPVWLEVDGGVDAHTAEAAAAAGADALVAGSAVFRAPRPAAALRALGAMAQKAYEKSFCVTRRQSCR